METVRVLFLTAWLLSSGFAVADANLRGYAKENGHQYLAFGRFPQTTDGKSSRFSGVF